MKGVNGLSGFILNGCELSADGGVYYPLYTSGPEMADE